MNKNEKRHLYKAFFCGSAYHWFLALYYIFFPHSTCACAVWFISIFSTVKSGFIAVASWMA